MDSSYLLLFISYIFKELLQLTITGIQAQLHQTSDRGDSTGNAHIPPPNNNYWSIGGILDWIQLDSQDPHVIEPVVLAPTQRLKLHKPTFATTIIMTASEPRDSNPRFFHISYMGALLQEMSFNVEQRDMMNAISFFTDAGLFSWEFSADGDDISRDGTEIQTAIKSESSSAAPSVSRVSDLESNTNTSVYIESLQLNPVKINLSFLKSAEDHQDFARDLVERMVDQKKSSHLSTQNLIFVVDLAMAITSSIRNAPIQLNAIYLEHVYKPPHQIRKMLISHYFQSIMWQVTKFCNFDLLGNPVSFAQTLGTGLTEFFVEPYQGILNSPSAFASGVFKGSRSLVTHTATGVFGAVESITEAVGSTAVNCTHLDHEFKQQRLRKTKPNCTHMLGRPFYDIGYSVVSGIFGIVKDPYDELRRSEADGCTGKSFAVLKGCSFGVLNVAAKPAVGFLDAASHFAELFSYFFDTYMGTSSLLPARRCRDAYCFGPGGRLLPFDESLAKGASIVSDRRSGNADGMLKALREFESHLVLLSNNSDQSPRAERHTGEECVIITEFVMKQKNEVYALIVTTKDLIILRNEYHRKADDTWDTVFTATISGYVLKRDRESTFQSFGDRHGYLCDLQLDTEHGATLTFRKKKIIHTDHSGRHKLIRVYFCASILNLNQWMVYWKRTLTELKKKPQNKRPKKEKNHDSKNLLDEFRKECDEVENIVQELKRYEHDIFPEKGSKTVLSFGSWHLQSPEVCRTWARLQQERQTSRPDRQETDEAGDCEDQEQSFNTWSWCKARDKRTEDSKSETFMNEYTKNAENLHSCAPDMYKKARYEGVESSNEKKMKDMFRKGAVTYEQLKSAIDFLRNDKTYLEQHKAEDIELMKNSMDTKLLGKAKVEEMRELMKGHVERRRKTMYFDFPPERNNLVKVDDASTKKEHTADDEEYQKTNDPTPKPLRIPGPLSDAASPKKKCYVTVNEEVEPSMIFSKESNPVADHNKATAFSPEQASISPLTANHSLTISADSLACIETRLEKIERLLQANIESDKPNDSTIAAASLVSLNESTQSQNSRMLGRLFKLEQKLAEVVNGSMLSEEAVVKEGRMQNMTFGEDTGDGDRSIKINCDQEGNQDDEEEDGFVEDYQKDTRDDTDQDDRDPNGICHDDVCQDDVSQDKTGKEYNYEDSEIADEERGASSTDEFCEQETAIQNSEKIDE